MHRSELSWTTDKNGNVLGARVHDGKIIGISISDETLSLEVRRVDGSLVIFELKGTEEWKLEFCNGTIVCDIYAWKVGSFPESGWKIPDYGWNALYGSRYKSDTKGRAEEIIRKMPDYFLVQFSGPSQGEDITAICKNMSVYEDISR